MSIWGNDDYGYGGGFSWQQRAEPKVTGEVLTAIRLTDENRGVLMRLAKQHFAMDAVVGANEDVIELRSIPNRAVRGLFDSKGGVGTVEVIPAGRARTDGVRVYRNEIVEAQKAEAAMARSSRRDNRWGDDDGYRPSRSRLGMRNRF